MWNYIPRLASSDTAAIRCCLLAFFLYYNTLDADFVYDDSRAILRNPDILSSTPVAELWHNDFWGTPLNSSESHGSYRPLCVLTFRLNHWLGGFRPQPFHLTNVLIHVLNTALVLRVARVLLPRSTSSVAALLFAAHPIHTEAVSGIVGRADLLACLFYLLSFLAYLRHISIRDRSLPNARTSRLTTKCCQEVQTPKCLLVLHEVLGYLRMSSSPFGLKHLPYSSTAARQCACLALCLVFAAMAMLSKETGLTVLLVCAMYDVIRSARMWPGAASLALSLGSLMFGLAGMLVLRLYLMGPHTPAFASADNPTARCPWLLTRILTFLYLPVFNLYLLLFPRWLSFDWSMDAIPRVASATDPRNLVALLVYYSLYKSTRLALSRVFAASSGSHVKLTRLNPKSRSCSSCKHPVNDSHSASCRANNNNNHVLRCECKHLVHPLVPLRTLSETYLMSLVFLIVPFLPATNFLFYVGFVVAERVLYLPSVGYCFVVALGVHLCSRRYNRRLARALFLLLLVTFGGRTIRRNLDWRDEESLYRSGLQINPPKAYGNLGSVLSSQGRTDEAERAFKLALRFRPNMADVHYNLGNLLQGRGHYEDAIKSYHNAIQCRPSLALAHLKLGQLLASRGRCDEAEQVFRRCATLDVTGLKDPRLHEDTKMAALLHLGRLHADRGRHQAAVQAYLQAVDTRPPHYQPQVLYNLLGESLSRLGRHGEAEGWYRAALEAKPDHVPAHITIGKHLARNKTRIHEAEQWFIKAQKLAPSDPSVFQQYGEFLSSQGRHSEAAQQLSTAAELAPLSYELVLAAATSLRQAGRLALAEQHYRRAVAIRPQDPTSHSNLGAMLHLNGKLTEAAASYREALKLEPSDVTTLTNLQKLRHLMARIET